MFSETMVSQPKAGVGLREDGCWETRNSPVPPCMDGRDPAPRKASVDHDCGLKLTRNAFGKTP